MASESHMTCLLCGRAFRDTSKHIIRIHGITIDEYRAKYGIPWTYGIACRETKALHSEHAKAKLELGITHPNPNFGELSKTATKRGRARMDVHLDQLQVMIDMAKKKARLPLCLKSKRTQKERQYLALKANDPKGYKIAIHDAMAARPQCHREEFARYWTGKTQSPEHIHKRVMNAKNTNGRRASISDEIENALLESKAPHK